MDKISYVCGESLTSDIMEQLVGIWQECFLDERDYICRFWDGCSKLLKVPTLRKKGKVVCVCYLLPVWIQMGEYGSFCKAWYLYALATPVSERKKGYAKRLLEEIHSHIPEPIILVPAQGLTSFYEKNGFSLWFHTSIPDCVISGEQSYPIPHREGLKIRKMIPDFDKKSGEDFVTEYMFLRKQSLRQEGYVGLDTDFLKYALSEHLYCGGEIYQIQSGSESDFGIIYVLSWINREENTLYIKEITAPVEQWQLYGQWIAGFLQVQHTKYPEHVVMENGRLTDLQKGYLGFTLG